MVSSIPPFSRDGLILEQQSVFCLQIIPVPVFSNLGAYLLCFTSLLDASLCSSFQHRSETNNAVIPQVPQRNQEGWDREAVGHCHGHPQNWLLSGNDPEVQIYVLNLCFNTQMGDEEKNKIQLHTKGKGRFCGSITPPDALLLSGEVSSDTENTVALWTNCSHGQKCICR